MKNVPNKVILHSAATPDYSDHSKKYDLFGAEDIDVWHRKRGFNGIGYHEVIRRTGRVQKGRDKALIGAHTKGHNQDSIGVCLVGTKLFTVPQWQSLLDLYIQYWDEYMIDWHNWFGHYEFDDGKICPGVDMNAVRAMLSLYHRNVIDCSCANRLVSVRPKIDPMDLS